MKKETFANTAFVRIAPKVRDRLRRHCQRYGLVMCGLVSHVLSEYLNTQETIRKAHVAKQKSKH